jgi:hypothetical protein
LIHVFQGNHDLGLQINAHFLFFGDTHEMRQISRHKGARVHIRRDYDFSLGRVDLLNFKHILYLANITFNTNAQNIGTFYMDYLNTLTKVLSGEKYANQNIQTSDGTTAYVTSTGIGKRYAAAADGTYGCPTDVLQVPTDWDTLGIAVGSNMVSGQSCGNEGQYVVAEPPKNQFDWQFYTQYYDVSGISTEDAAFAHWNTQGKQQARLPNASILQTMSQVGKVGYVDLNTTMRPLAADAVQYGDYKTYKKRSNVIGTNMVDCTTPTPAIQYGDKVYLSDGTNFGQVVSSQFAFNGIKDSLIIRPPVGSTATGAVKYGDSVLLASSITNSYSDSCGYYGCKVGAVNTSTLALEFGPGNSATPLTLNPSPGSTYSLGDPIIYGEAFSVSVSLPPPMTTLKQGGILFPGDNMASSNGAYVLVYQTDGNVCLYPNSGGDPVWQSGVTHSAAKLTLQANGSLVAYDTTGAPKWGANTTGGGVPPFSLQVANTGQLLLMDGEKTVLWSTPSQTEDSASNVTYFAVATSILAFDATDQGSTFLFATTTPNTSNACDMSVLQQQCNESAGCAGYVHSPDNNTWQMVSEGASYGISPTVQDFYMKMPTVQLTGENCPGRKPATFIDAAMFQTYPQGDPVASTAACSNPAAGILDPAQDKYQARVQAEEAGKKKFVANYKTLSGNIKDLTNSMVSNTSQAANYQDVITKLKNVESFTMQKQKTDAAIMERMYMSRSTVWGVLALASLGLLLLVKQKKQGS